MKASLVFFLIASLNCQLTAQNITKSLTSLLHNYDGIETPVETLEEVYDVNGLLLKQTYTDLNKGSQQMIVAYRYDDDTKVKETYYHNQGMSEPLLTSRSTTMQKLLDANTVIERTTYENIAKAPFWYRRDGIIDDHGISLEGRGPKYYIDTTALGIKYAITEGYDSESLISITKNYSPPVNNVAKVELRYWDKRDKQNFYTLFTGTFTEVIGDTEKEIFVSFEKEPFRGNIENTKVFDRKGNLLGQRALKYEYEYDEYGNWTSRTAIYNGNPFKKIIRELTY